MGLPDSAGIGAGGALNGHGVGFAMVGIFAGMGLVVAIAASDGAVLGLNFNPSPNDSASQVDIVPDSAGIDSGDVFAENSETGNTDEVARGKVGLTEEHRMLLAMSDFSWDSISAQYIESGQGMMDMIDRQNFTRPALPERESISLTENYFLVDPDEDLRRASPPIEIERPVETMDDVESEDPEENDERAQPGDSHIDEEDYGLEPEDETDLSEQGSDEYSGSGPEEDEQRPESEGEGDSGDHTNVTDTNSTETESFGGFGGESDSNENSTSTEG